ncbi:MAG TPA: hypothetical protein VGZ25_10030 [Gemmataceae bacterium]|nr:hypothetical protein [Gemmataceae bacterium]
MPLAVSVLMQRQLARARRRLFVQILLDHLAWCCAGAVMLAIVWFLVEPYLIQTPPEWLRWAVAGSFVSGGVLLSLFLAIMRRPAAVDSALKLDQRFGLKERVTTALLLSPDQQTTPAGRALLADVNERLSNLDIGSRFPLRLSWNVGLVPVTILALGLVALLYEPAVSKATSKVNEELALAPETKADLDKEMQKLAKKEKPKKADGSPKNEKLDEIDDELEKLLNQPRETKDQVKDRIKDLTEVEDKIKDEQKAVEDKAEAIKEQLQQMDRLSKKDKKTEEDPGKDLDKAMSEGNLDKAKEEMDRLAKKLKDKELSEPEKEQLRNELHDVEDKLQRLSREKEDLEKEEDRLRELSRKGEIDQDTLDRELDQLMKNSDKLNREAEDKLKEAADLMKQAEQDLKEGKDEEAAEKMQQAADKMQQAQGEGESQALAEQLVRVQKTKRVLTQGLGKKGEGKGRRPEDKEGETKSLDTKVTGKIDPKGKKEVTGSAPGHSFKKKSSAEMQGEIQQASQEAPEAIERQRLPRAANEITKGYFENLGGQKGQRDKKEKP